MVMTNPTIEDLSGEILRLMDCLDDIRQMASARKSCIRMADGTMLDNYCRRALHQADDLLNRYGLLRPSHNTASERPEPPHP